MTFPVIQSVLDGDSLAAELARRYGLTLPVKCRLISRGMNDIYDVRSADARHAVKIARAGKADDAAFIYELAFVQHLADAGLAVPAAVADRAGRTLFAVDAPEGLRQVVLMRWLNGTPLTKSMNTADAHRLGAYLARLHAAATSFAPAVGRSPETERKIGERLPALLELVADDASSRAFLKRTAEEVVARIGQLDRATMPFGAIHGDFQYANVMTTPDGALAIFDFSDCGQDFLARDLVTFFWRSDFDGVGDALNPAFVAGYQSVRRLSAAEESALPLFRLARHLLITASMAEFVNRIGPIPGFDGRLADYLSMIRRVATAADIK